MLKSAAVLAERALRRGVRVLVAGLVWLEQTAFALFVVMVWPLIFVVLAMIAGMFGWTGFAASVNSVAVQLFTLLLVLFVLVVSMALAGADHAT